MPSIVSDPAAWRKQRAALEGTLGFVPTMGNLHEGHMALVRRARAENDHVLVSIFVNPTQFNQRADYDAYLRTLENDVALLGREGVEFVFAPDEKSMYPDNYEMQVNETVLSQQLEGKFRPGHFQGMLTVVLKLLNIAGATRVYFGEKDYQQLMLVKKMAEAFFLPVEVVAVPTVREDSGLALSSRNGRLTPAQHEKAVLLSQLLQSAAANDAVAQKLDAAGFKTEYVATEWGRRLVAAWLGDVRLIDNVQAKGE